MKIKKGDKVKVIKGKDRGKEGTVERVLPLKNCVVIPGINVFKKHLKKKGDKQEGGIIDIVKPIQIQNVMIVCQKCLQGTRVGYKIAGKEKRRICKKCGEVLDTKKRGKK